MVTMQMALDGANYLAAGGADFSSITSWIQSFKSPILITVNTIVGVAAVIIVGWLITKAIMAAKSGQVKDAMKFLVPIVVVVLLALAGIGGVITLVNSIAPDTGTGTFSSNSQFSGD